MTYTTEQIVAALRREIEDLATGWHPEVPPEIQPRIDLLRALAESYPKLVEDAEKWRESCEQKYRADGFPEDAI